MQVEIDSASGFCFGVVNAISKAEEALRGGGRVSSLGDIVHNTEELNRLAALGLHTVSNGEISPAVGTLIIRAHGEPPSTYETIRASAVRYIDATCPVVARLQNRVKEAYDKMRAVGGQVVIFGKRGHAEVVGLTGQIGDDCTVVESVEDLASVDMSRPVCLLSQTTSSLAKFRALSDELLRRSRVPESVEIIDTVCRQVANRENGLKQFAARYDVVIFVSGRTSSNGRVLGEACREANPHTFCVENETELREEWFKDAESVGVCGATSTPAWLMERVADKIKTYE